MDVNPMNHVFTFDWNTFYFEGILPHYWLKFHYWQLREYISIKIFDSKIQLRTVENNKLNWPSILINLEQCTGSIWCQKRSNNCYRYISWIYAQWMKQNISNFLFHTKMYALQGATTSSQHEKLTVCSKSQRLIGRSQANGNKNVALCVALAQKL